MQEMSLELAISTELVAIETWAGITYGWKLCILSLSYLALIVAPVVVDSEHIPVFLTLAAFGVFFAFFILSYRAFFHAPAN